MKNILSYILLCGMLFALSCTKDTPLAEGEGAIAFRIDVGDQTRTYDPLETLLIRIYRADGGLIRRYTSLDQMPENLQLVAGDYSITVEAGDNSPATWTNKTYRAEKPFTILANQTITEQIICPSLNVGAKVEFDATVIKAMDKGAHVYVSASNAFDLEAIEQTPTLRYELSETAQTGYFLLPEGVENLSWAFYAENSTLGKFTQSGTIEQVEAMSTYKLKFQYSKTPDGFGDISVQVDKDTEDHYDHIGFSPQPSIKGDGFTPTETVGFHNNDIRFAVTSVTILDKITMRLNETTYTLLTAGVPDTSQAGITYQATDDKNGVIILTPEFLSTQQAGIHVTEFEVQDNKQGLGEGSFSVAIPGTLPVTTSDYTPWNDAVTLKTIVTDPAATEVKIAYRTGEGEWNELQAAESEKFVYTAQTAPTWQQATNAKGKTVYKIERSLSPNSTYEFRSLVNGVEGATHSFATPQGNTIPTLNDSNLSCYGEQNESATFWGSGNNSMASTLCNYSADFSGANLAALSNAGTELVAMFAPGNLFTGTFKYASMNGTVSFGNKYTFTARPKALKLKYKGSIGNVTHNKHGGPLASDTPDKARIFVAIVDWSTQHKVTSGTKAPSGMWSPEDGIDAVTEGKVIGYSLLDLEGTVNDLTELTLPINYYDKELKPAAGNYSLVISCATSAYGDYINGCKTNKMYISDFTWEY